MRLLFSIFNTIRHLRFIQIWNRISRRFLPRGAAWGNESGGAMPEFTFLNQMARPKGWNDVSLPKLWLYNLHYFDWLNIDDGCEEAKSLPLIERWINENPRGWGNGWEPYPISLRVVNWIKYLMSRNECNKKIEKSIVEQVEWLIPRLEYHLLANHLLANAKALVFAGKYLDRDDWYKKGMNIYKKELPEQVLDDGVHFELSPMYHCIMLEDVLDCWEYTEEELFENYATKMVVALDLIAGPDGRISLFNDSAYGIAKEPDILRARFVALGGKKSASKGGGRLSGFVKLQKGAWTLIAKCGEIGPSYQPGHAHADTGSFELWNGREKLISDTGTDRYVVDDERKRHRGTSAHNCVMVDGKNSSEVWAGHRVARRVRSQGWKIGANGASVTMEYVDYHGFRIRRKLELSDEGLVGADEIFGKGVHDIELRWHMMPEADILVESEGDIMTESCKICVEFGRQINGMVKIMQKKVKLPCNLKWSVKKQ